MLLRATGLGRRIGDAGIWRGVDVQLQAGRPSPRPRDEGR